VVDGRVIGMVDVSIGPRICEGESVSSRVPGGWIGSNSAVASPPAKRRIMFAPPGWDGRKSDTS